MVPTLNGDAKPLPNLPQESTTKHPGAPPLTTAAFEHLRRLLAASLHEEKLAEIWLPHLQTAINELVEAVRKGSWLTGAVRRRRQSRSQSASAPLASSEPKPTAEGANHTTEGSGGTLEKELKKAVESVINTPSEDASAGALALLHDRVAKPVVPGSDTSLLLITLAPSKVTRPFPDLGVEFDLKPHRESCVFTPGQFALPLFDDKQTNGATMLSGFEEWKELVADPQSPHAWQSVNIVGGRFSIGGIHTTSDHTKIARVLRLGVYCALAMQLEISLQQDFGIPLVFPPPPLPRQPAPTSHQVQPTEVIERPPSPKSHRRASKSTGSGIWGFLAKKTTEVLGKPLHRVVGLPGSHSELHSEHPDIRDVPKPAQPSSMSSHLPQRGSLDLIRTISTQMKLSASDQFVQSNDPRSADAPTIRRPFIDLVDRIRAQSLVLSTSPDVHIPPPSLLVRLSERERALIDNNRTAPALPLRLSGDDRTGLSSILGWSDTLLKGKDPSEVESAMTEMIGTKAFIKHQHITVLYAEHVPPVDEPAVKDLVTRDKETDETTPKAKGKEKAAPEPPAKPTEVVEGGSSTFTDATGASDLAAISKPTSKSSEADTTRSTEGLQTTMPCIGARWKTLQYFPRSDDSDPSLGRFVVDVCSASESGELCKKEGCGRPRKVHGMAWIHAAVKVVATLAESDTDGTENDAMSGEEVRIWTSCRICDATAEKEKLADGSFLFPFSKYLELLIYSRSFATSLLCEHTSATVGSTTTQDPKLPTTASYPAPSLPAQRFNIIRHFQWGRTVITFTVSPIDSDVFEVKAPRLQIVRDVAEIKKADAVVAASPDAHTSFQLGLVKSFDDPEKEELRLQITDWWMGLKEYMTKLEDFLAGSTVRVRTKRLPTTPEVSDDESETEASSERRPSSPKTRASTSTRSLHTAGQKESLSTVQPVTPEEPLASTSSEPPGPTQSLATLRLAFLTAELDMYKQLADTPSIRLNDVRRRFRSSSSLAIRRLRAWVDKEASGAKDEEKVGEFDPAEFGPTWFSKSSYIPPGSHVIVRDKDWGSVIAFTLSSQDYERELRHMASGVASSPTTSEPSTVTDKGKTYLPSTPSTVSLASQDSQTGSQVPYPMARKMSAASSVATTAKEPDLAVDLDDWDSWPCSEEQYSSVITRKEHPKDVTGLLGLRDVLRHQRSVEPTPPGSGLSGPSTVDTAASTAGGLSSRFSSLGTSASHLIRLGISPLAVTTPAQVVAPPTAWAKAESQISTESIKGEVRAGPGGSNADAPTTVELLVASLDQVLPENESQAGPGRDPLGFAVIAGPVSGEANPPVAYSTIKVSPSKFARAPSAVEEASEDEQSLGASIATLQIGSSNTNTTIATHDSSDGRSTPTLGSSLATHLKESTGSTIGPPVPPKDHAGSFTPSTPRTSARVVSSSSTTSYASSKLADSAATQGSITSTVASAIRYVLGAPTPPSPQRYVGLLALQNNASLGPTPLYPPIDDRPHIKHDITIDKKVKFSCTVYYARQFDFLRKRCGVGAMGSNNHSDLDMVRSIERCVGWSAEGGKSKSSFLKSEDGRYIIKSLVNAWNVADLQVLLELAPSYFRYLESTANHASVLAKLMGFYTIEVQNLDPKSGNGSSKMKADVLVMENLFWNFKIAPGRAFDLKGISGRKVKPSTGPTSSSSNGSISDDKSKDHESSKEPNRRRARAIAPAPAPTAVQKPLYDGDWIEGQQKAMILVEPHSKAVLHEGVRRDAEFLAKSNIMDYSLLLGIDQERRQIACGLVDTIGSYTFAKTLEYKAKQGLIGHSGKQITVIPPSEYQERFVNAMEGYFFACPDKWSKPSSNTADSVNDYLPSVF